MHQAFRNQAIDGAGNLNGQDPGDCLSVVRHHKLVPLGDPSEVLAEVIAKISNANLHGTSRCGDITMSYYSHVVRDPCAKQREMVVMRGRERTVKKHL